MKDRPITQYTLEGVFIRTYKNSAIASYHTGIRSSSIRFVCKGEWRWASGYVWRYSDGTTNDITKGLPKRKMKRIKKP